MLSFWFFEEKIERIHLKADNERKICWKSQSEFDLSSNQNAWLKIKIPFKEGNSSARVLVYLKKRYQIFLEFGRIIQCWFVAIIVIIIIMSTATAATLTKPFQFIRALFQATGIYSPQLNENRLINTKVLLIFLCSAQFLVASIAYFMFEAESIGDLAYSYLLSLTLSMLLGFMIINTLKIPKILQLIEKFDEFIRTSKFFLRSVILLAKFTLHFQLDRIIIGDGWKCGTQIHWNKW